MGKKKPQSGSSEERRQTARRMVGLPEKWFEVAQQLARKKPTPTVWYIVELIKREAEAAGIKDLPPPPWETEDK
jgi:hypothetical protein